MPLLPRLALTATLLAPTPILAQTRTPDGPAPKIDAAARTRVVEALAKALDERYVFPDLGKKMAQTLRDKLAANGYDPFDTGDLLAGRLQEDIRAVAKDRHLRVGYAVEPPPQPPAGEPTPEQLNRMREGVRKRNAGFVRVERLPGNVGLIELRAFTDAEAGADTLAAAMSFVSNTDALVLDLRRNGGGTPLMVQRVCSYLFPADARVHLNSLYFRRGDRTEEFWTLKDLPGKRYVDKPVYVLTSRFTFSGAEECTYNLQSLKRATVVGETTGGGAHPGGTVPLSDHFVAFVPTGRAINPVTKTNWEGTGVKPDVPVDADKALEKAHELAVEHFRKTITDPRMKADMERDLEQEKRLQARYRDRNEVRKD